MREVINGLEAPSQLFSKVVKRLMDAWMVRTKARKKGYSFPGRYSVEGEASERCFTHAPMLVNFRFVVTSQKKNRGRTLSQKEC